MVLFQTDILIVLITLLIYYPTMYFQPPIFYSADSAQYFDHSHFFSEDENGFFGDQMNIFICTQLNQKEKEQLNVSSPVKQQDSNLNDFEEAHHKQPESLVLGKVFDHVEEQDHFAVNLKQEGKRNVRKQKNDTKNIPKNFGKGIMNFIQKYQRNVRQLLTSNNLDSNDFFKMIRNEKKTINTIADLRSLWTHQKYGPVLRILSNLFFRKHSFSYIFNSRISSFSTHLKYRHILWLAISNPQNFNRIKQY